MFDIDKHNSVNTSDQLSKIGYWPAVALQYFDEKKYSKAVELCRENLSANSSPLSARMIYAKALYHAGQIESAEKQLNIILSVDSDHLVALKYLADIKFQQDEQFTAVTMYEQILSIDPLCTMLYSELQKKKEQSTTTTITLKRQKEEPQPEKKDLRKVLYYSETVGDLYLKQGYPRLAEEVFAHLYEKNNNPRLAEKLSLARENIKDKE